MTFSEASAISQSTKRAANAVRAALRAALDLALPPLCAACRQPVEGRGLCPACWSKLSFITRPYCERLGTPFVYDPGPGILSMEAVAHAPAYHRARAAVRFDEISRALVYALKYADRLDLAPMMGRWIAHAARARAVALAAVVGVPFQPVRHACSRNFQGDRPAGRRGCAQARKADYATVRPIPDRAGGQCARRISRAGGWQSGSDPAAPRPHRRCTDDGRHGG
jgi:hypothetical protein